MALAGRLSSPSPKVDKLLDRLRGEQPVEPSARPAPHPRVLKVQHRLAAEVVSQLVAAYQAGATIPELVDRFQIHRTTVSGHLERHGVPRRANRRKLTDDQIAEAAQLYAAGWSTAKIGKQFDVSAETALQTLRKAGIPIRPRQGWIPSN